MHNFLLFDYDKFSNLTAALRPQRSAGLQPVHVSLWEQQSAMQAILKYTHIICVSTYTDMHTHTLQEMCANEQNTNMNADKHHMCLQFVLF